MPLGVEAMHLLIQTCELGTHGGSTHGATGKWILCHGKSENTMDDLGLPPFQETTTWTIMENHVNMF